MKICIVGGSTAGWWAAGYLEKNMPECEIVLYDSPDIPNLGVGESTLPQIKTWFDDIGIKEENWFDKCNAVKKYGNYKQGWNTPPIDDSMTLRFWYDRGLFEDLFIEPQNWNKDQTPKKQNFYDVFETNYDYAYHICAESSGKMLKNFCERTETRYETLDKLPPGFDLYLDCTGFSRKFVNDFTEMSISKYHILDNAWVINLQRENDVPICDFTKSIAKKYGWQFQIDLQNRTGIGYVFSSQHIDVESALLEFRTFYKNRTPVESGHLCEPKLYQWKPLVLQNPWSNNIVALGTSAGFVEPLEATTLFNLQAGITTLVRCLKHKIPSKVYNRQMRNIWRDSLRFIECHYTLSDRKDSSFWRYITKEKPKYQKLIWEYYDKYSSEFTNIFPSGVWAQQIIYMYAYDNWTTATN